MHAFYCLRRFKEFLKWIQFFNAKYWNCARCPLDHVGLNLASLIHDKIILTFKAKPIFPLTLADRKLWAQGQRALTSSPAMLAAISPGLLASLHNGFCWCSISHQGCVTSKSRQCACAAVKEQSQLQASKTSGHWIFSCGYDLWISSAPSTNALVTLHAPSSAHSSKALQKEGISLWSAF